MSEPTDKYKHFNHHHEITDDQEFIEIGGQKIIADKKMVSLLKALNDLGLETRTHNYNKEECWVSIVFDNRTQVNIRKIQESNATRTRFNGKTEVLLSWMPKTW